MMLPDVNVLIYAVNASSPQHAAAKAWIEQSLSSSESVAFAWVAVLGFIRLSTLKVVMKPPLTVGHALELVNNWLSHPLAQIVHPTAQHEAILARLFLGAGTAGNLTTDAHLAALAIEHRATLVTFDRDFERFAGLRVKFL